MKKFIFACLIVGMSSQMSGFTIDQILNNSDQDAYLMLYTVPVIQPARDPGLPPVKEGAFYPAEKTYVITSGRRADSEVGAKSFELPEGDVAQVRLRVATKKGIYHLNPLKNYKYLWINPDGSAIGQVK